MIPIHVTNGDRVGQFEGIDRSMDWTGAACASHDPALWFPEPLAGHTEWDAARDICDTCPIRDVCLEYALSRETDSARHRYGMWGGKTPSERASIALKRRRKPRPLIPLAERTAPTQRPQCGTAMGYEAHRRHGERSCDACRAANAEYHAARRARSTR